MSNEPVILPTVVMDKIFEYKHHFNKALKAEKELDYFGELIEHFPNISDSFIEKLASENFIHLCVMSIYLKNKIEKYKEDESLRTILAIKEDMKSIYTKLIETRKVKNLQEIKLGICNPNWHLEQDNILYKGITECDNVFAANTFLNFFESSGLYKEEFEDVVIDQNLGEEYKHLNHRLKKYFQYIKFFDFLPWMFKTEIGWIFEREFDEHGNDNTEGYMISEIDIDYVKISWVYNKN
jgi:hypothetical protein